VGTRKEKKSRKDKVNSTFQECEEEGRRKVKVGVSRMDGKEGRGWRIRSSRLAGLCRSLQFH
jgi:hypothetical protein